jgi:hypothetical protein
VFVPEERKCAGIAAMPAVFGRSRTTVFAEFDW